MHDTGCSPGSGRQRSLRCVPVVARRGTRAPRHTCQGLNCRDIESALRPIAQSALAACHGSTGEIKVIVCSIAGPLPVWGRSLFGAVVGLVAVGLSPRTSRAQPAERAPDDIFEPHHCHTPTTGDTTACVWRWSVSLFERVAELRLFHHPRQRGPKAIAEYVDCGHLPDEAGLDVESLRTPIQAPRAKPAPGLPGPHPAAERGALAISAGQVRELLQPGSTPPVAPAGDSGADPSQARRGGGLPACSQWLAPRLSASRLTQIHFWPPYRLSLNWILPMIGFLFGTYGLWTGRE